MFDCNNSLLLAPTLKSPLIDFNVGGILVIEGRSIDENIEDVFIPAIDWCKSIKIQFVYLTIKLDYINNSSARQLNQIFHNLQINENVSDVQVSWYTDIEDCSQYEMGRIFEELYPDTGFKFFRI